jgi:hypothetical protein
LAAFLAAAISSEASTRLLRRFQAVAEWLGELGYGKAFLQMLDLIFGWILKWQHLIVLIRADEAVQFG